MNAAPPTVMPILATPLAIATIPDSLQLNTALLELFKQRCSAQSRPLENSLRYSSHDDLMEWPDPPVRRLADGIIGAVYSVISQVSDITEMQLRSLKLETRAWFTLVRTNGAVPAASYPLTSWCAIYCVAAPPRDTARADSGVVRFYESRLGSMFQDATNAVMRIPYLTSHYAWHPEAGQLVIFPAALTHEIALLRAAGELILVTARIRFIGPGQQGFARW